MEEEGGGGGGWWRWRRLSEKSGREVCRSFLARIKKTPFASHLSYSSSCRCGTAGASGRSRAGGRRPSQARWRQGRRHLLMTVPWVAIEKCFAFFLVLASSSSSSLSRVERESKNGGARKNHFFFAFRFFVCPTACFLLPFASQRELFPCFFS